MITIDKTVQVKFNAKKIFDTFNRKQKRVVVEIIAAAFENEMPRIEILGGYTYIRSIFDSLDIDQQTAAYYLIGRAAMKTLTSDDLQVLKGDINE